MLNEFQLNLPWAKVDLRTTEWVPWASTSPLLRLRLWGDRDRHWVTVSLFYNNFRIIFMSVKSNKEKMGCIFVFLVLNYHCIFLSIGSGCALSLCSPSPILSLSCHSPMLSRLVGCQCPGLILPTLQHITCCWSPPPSSNICPQKLPSLGCPAACWLLISLTFKH